MGESPVLFPFQELSDGDHGHTAFSFLEREGVVVIVIQLSLFWKGKGWWSLSYSFLFLEREGVVVLVIQLFLLGMGMRRGGGHGHTEPSLQKSSPMVVMVIHFQG